MLKPIFLPVKLLKRIVGNEDSPEEWSSTADAESGNTKVSTGTRADAPSGVSQGAAQAEKNIQWFRGGLLTVGVLQIVLGLFGAVSIAQSPVGAAQPALVGGLLLGIVVFIFPPIGIALGLTRRPTGSWYAGIAFCGLQIVLSLFSLPGGLITIGIYGVLGYLGYTGRPALTRLLDAEDSPTEDESMTDELIDQQSRPTREATETTASTPSQSESAVDSPGETTTSSQTGRADTPPADAARTAPASGPTDEEVEATVDSDTESDRIEQSEPDAAETDSSGTDSDDGAADGDPVDEYRERLEADSSSVRKSAVEYLLAATQRESVPDQAAIDALSERLEDTDPEIRAVACRGLSQLSAEQTKSRLEYLRINTDLDVSRAAIQVLRNIE